MQALVHIGPVVRITRSTICGHAGACVHGIAVALHAHMVWLQNVPIGPYRTDPIS
jgi:hypothetical protein